MRILKYLNSVPPSGSAKETELMEIQGQISNPIKNSLKSIKVGVKLPTPSPLLFLVPLLW